MFRYRRSMVGKGYDGFIARSQASCRVATMPWEAVVSSVGCMVGLGRGGVWRQNMSVYLTYDNPRGKRKLARSKMDTGRAPASVVRADAGPHDWQPLPP